jgi:hypothetical protein
LTNFGLFVVDESAAMLQFDGQMTNFGSLAVHSSSLWYPPPCPPPPPSYSRCFDSRVRGATVVNFGAFSPGPCGFYPSFVNARNGTVVLDGPASFYGNTSWDGVVIFGPFGNTSLSVTWNQFSSVPPSRHVISTSLRFVGSGAIVGSSGYLTFTADIQLPPNVRLIVSYAALNATTPLTVNVTAPSPLPFCGSVNGPVTLRAFAGYSFQCGSYTQILNGARVIVPDGAAAVLPYTELFIAHGATLVVEKGGVLNLTTSSASVTTRWSSDPDGGARSDRGTLQNDGVVDCLGRIEALLVNRGTLLVSRGFVRFGGGGSISGTIAVSADGYFRFGGVRPGSYPPIVYPPWLRFDLAADLKLATARGVEPRSWNGQLYTYYPFDFGIETGGVPVALAPYATYNFTMAVNGTLIVQWSATVWNLILSNGAISSPYLNAQLKVLNKAYLMTSTRQNGIKIQNVALTAINVTASDSLAMIDASITTTQAILLSMDSDFVQPRATASIRSLITTYGSLKYNFFYSDSAPYPVVLKGPNAFYDFSYSSYLGANLTFDGAIFYVTGSLTCVHNASIAVLAGSTLMGWGQFPSLQSCNVTVWGGGTISSQPYNQYGTLILQATLLKVLTGARLLFQGGSSHVFDTRVGPLDKFNTSVVISDGVALLFNATYPPTLMANLTALTLPPNTPPPKLTFGVIYFSTFIFDTFYTPPSGVYNLRLSSIGQIIPPQSLYITQLAPNRPIAITWVGGVCPGLTKSQGDTVELADGAKVADTFVGLTTQFQTRSYSAGAQVALRVKTKCGAAGPGQTWVPVAVDSGWSAWLNVTVPQPQPPPQKRGGAAL